MKEENNAVCYNHRLLTGGTHAETVPTVPSTGLLIGWARVDGSHSALSFNTPAFKHSTECEWSHPVVYLYIHFITIYYRQHNYNTI